MYIEKPLPFYAAYPFFMGMDQEKEQERDMQVMKSYYSKTAAAIQELVEQECDRMEYDGSMMFDEYPDKLMMEHLCRRIAERYMDQASQRPEEMEAMSRSSDDGLRDLIGVLLYNEMFCRRCRQRRRRRRFY